MFTSDLLSQKDNMATQNPLLQVSSLPHSVLLAGNNDLAEQYIKEYLDSLGLDTNNPNIFWKKYDSVQIDAVRDIAEISQKTSMGDSPSFFIVMWKRIGVASQNAFLKTLEEPAIGTTFFLCCEDESALLDTVLSRVQIIKLLSGVSHFDIEQFMMGSYSQREEMVKPLWGDSKKKISADRAGTRIFLSQILESLAETRQLDLYRQIEQFITYCNDQSSSVKYMTEFCCTSIPRKS